MLARGAAVYVQWISSWSQVLAHTTAFASIEAFGQVQQLFGAGAELWWVLIMVPFSLVQLLWFFEKLGACRAFVCRVTGGEHLLGDVKHEIEVFGGR